MEWITKKRWIILPCLLLFLFVANLSLGSVRIPLLEIISILSGKASANPVWNDIVWDFRMTKALTCILAGSALSIAGLQMQTLFRNALAGPDVLGLKFRSKPAGFLIINESGYRVCNYFRLQVPGQL